MILIAGILIVYGIMPGVQILYFPLILCAMIIFSVALGLFVTPIGLIYTDISRLITIGVPFLMYFTPVVYAVPKQGLFKTLFELNPLTFLFNDARNALIGVQLENLPFTLILGILSFAFMLIGLVIFRKSMPILIEKIGG